MIAFHNSLEYVSIIKTVRSCGVDFNDLATKSKRSKMPL